MDKQQKKEVKNTALLATGSLTEYAFLQSLVKSKTLIIVTSVTLLIMGGLAWFLYKMAGA